jgi:peptidoglycan/LPS O-acetylase OafA/YrhL
MAAAIARQKKGISPMKSARAAANPASHWSYSLGALARRMLSMPARSLALAGRRASPQAVPGPSRSSRRGGGQPARVPELDALRAIGAFAILAYHLWPTTFFFGWSRADLFFVISGYLITSIIVKHHSKRKFLVTFWARRALRIWPAYYLMLAIVCAIAMASGNPLRPASIASYLTFTQNTSCYWSTNVPSISGAAAPTWSLAIEEQFYLLWPLVLVWTGPSRVVPIALWLLVNSVASRSLGLFPVVALARCDGLALGSILAVILDKEAIRSGRALRGISLAFLAIGLASLFFLSSPLVRHEPIIPGTWGCGSLTILGVNVLYASILGLIVCHTGHPWLGLLRSRAVCYVGQISYGIFLYHEIVIGAVGMYLGHRTIWSHAVAIVLSISVAALSWEFLERPIGNLKNRFNYDRDRGGDEGVPAVGLRPLSTSLQMARASSSNPCSR